MCTKKQLELISFIFFFYVNMIYFLDHKYKNI